MLRRALVSDCFHANNRLVISFLHSKVIQGMPTCFSLSVALWSMIIIQKYELVRKWALVPGSPEHVPAQLYALMKAHLYKSAPCHVPLGRLHPTVAAGASNIIKRVEWEYTRYYQPSIRSSRMVWTFVVQRHLAVGAGTSCRVIKKKNAFGLWFVLFLFFSFLKRKT